MDSCENNEIRVAWIDDEAPILEDALFGLMLFDIQADGYQDPQTVMQKIESNDFNYDIVVTDLKMDVFSGQDIIKAIRERGGTASLYVASGTAKDEISAELEVYSIEGYFDKPFMIDQVAKTVSDKLKDKGVA